MEQEMTRWFRGNVTPARVGVYQRTFGDGNVCYSLWDGGCWRWVASNVADAYGEPSRSGFQKLRWRGLAADPKGQA